MSNRKRLLAICVGMLTIPAFTMGEAPYYRSYPAGQAYAITAGEYVASNDDTLVIIKGPKTFEQDIAESTSVCGTETETNTTEAMTTSTVTETETTTTTEVVTTTEATKPETTTTAEVVSTTEVPTFEEPSEEETSIEVIVETDTFESSVATEDTEVEAETETEESTAVTGADEFVWEGKKLTRSGGVVAAGETPSGLRETWYNLPMFGCLDLIGYSRDGYAERADGFKTYNGYIMVASPDLSRWPKGSYIETTNGMGIVVDFCPGGNLDIAVTW